LRAQDQHRVALRKVEREEARRGEVLVVIEPALAFLRVAEAAIPVGFVRIGAVALRHDNRLIRVRLPANTVAHDVRRKVECRIFVMQCVIVAARKQRAHLQRERFMSGLGLMLYVARTHAFESPPQHGLRGTVRDEHLGRDLPTIADTEAPRGPRLGVEGHQVGRNGRMQMIRHVTMPRKGITAATRRLDPRFDAIDEHDTARRRMRGRKQQRVIAARPFTTGRARGEAAPPVGFEPLGLARFRAAVRGVDARHVRLPTIART
jgi:hypothetical protein